MLAPDRLSFLEERMAKLEQQLRELRVQAGEDHEDRLDDHERRLMALQGDLESVKRELKSLTSHVGRLSDIATAQGLTLERVLRNTNRIVEILEPTVVIKQPQPEASNAP